MHVAVRKASKGRSGKEETALHAGVAELVENKTAARVRGNDVDGKWKMVDARKMICILGGWVMMTTVACHLHRPCALN